MLDGAMLYVVSCHLRRTYNSLVRRAHLVFYQLPGGSSGAICDYLVFSGLIGRAWLISGDSAF